MDPYIKDKELIIIRKIHEGWEPQRYDVVVVSDGEDKLAKRIIGLEGDEIRIKEITSNRNDSGEINFG